MKPTFYIPTIFLIILLSACAKAQSTPDSAVINFHKYASEQNISKVESLFSKEALEAYGRYQDNIWKGIFNDFPPIDSAFTASQTDSAAAVFTYSGGKVNQVTTLLEEDGWKITFPIFTRTYDRDGLIEIDGLIYVEGDNWMLRTMNINNMNQDVRYAFMLPDKEFGRQSAPTLKERLENMIGKECLTIIGNVSRAEKNDVWQNAHKGEIPDDYPTTRGIVENVFQSGTKFGETIFKIVGKTSQGKGFMMEIGG